MHTQHIEVNRITPAARSIEKKINDDDVKFYV
jgi:hypothetical protein